LYAEFSRTLRHPARWDALARRAGFSEARLCWHWPDFENCARMVPLEDATALLFTIRHKHAPVTAAIAAAGVRWLQRTHLIGWAAGHFSLVAVK
jgi:hypothetical protein